MLCKNRAPGTDKHVEKPKISGWERSKLSAQDHKILKRMGLFDKEAMKMPGDESSPHPPIGFRVTFIGFLIRGLSVPIHEFLHGLIFIYGIQLHQLTPNSLLHISIFITLCECFLGIHPHWSLWKRIFYLRSNNSRNVTYNVGGVCICVRPEVGYFDVMFADSVQGWRRKWLYFKDESTAAQEYGLAPFEPTEDIQRRRSWDAEVSDEEKAATAALLARIQELQNTYGAELLGVQIIAHFLRIRIQPLQARKNPMWMYSGPEDSDRNHQILSSMLESEPAESQKTAGSSDDETESEQRSDSAQSISRPPAASPDKRKRKKGDDEDSGASKLAEPAAEESLPEVQENFDPYAMTGAVSSGDEEEIEPDTHGPAVTSTSNTLVLSEDQRIAPETSRPPRVDLETTTPVPSPRAPNPKKARTGVAGKQELASGSMSIPLLEDPLMKKLVDLGSHFIGFRDEAATLREALRHAEERADALEAKLKVSEEAKLKAIKEAKLKTDDLEAKLKASEIARKKPEKDASGVEDLRRRLQAAEDALSDKEAKQVECENAIIKRLETQSRRFSRKMGEQYTLSQESEDRLTDTLDILELNCDLAQNCIASARNALKRVFPHFFTKDVQPEVFAQLAHHFLQGDDPALA
ncbi:hypothetical protein QYE76_028087 [Lolium multiflorum]|uniref:Transposase (putative) gypsy type domain-containing protein n=1 Tax=Lolium multiflorum TaxID=4521 RepID=A0AAD8VFG8_LOLMU|nr:hypothetical protein QYE76_028087 [Lolium multiflorum]